MNTIWKKLHFPMTVMTGHDRKITDLLLETSLKGRVR